MGKSRRKFLQLVGSTSSLAGLAALPGCGNEEDPDDVPPVNILLIVADDIGVDVLRINEGEVIAQVNSTDPDTMEDVATAGAAPLEHLGRMLNSGLHFSNAWAHPVCSPSRGSLFTGLQPWKNSVGFPAGGPGTNNKLPAQDIDGNEIVTLAQALSAETDYVCGLFGKWDLLGDDIEAAKDEFGPVARGWDHFEGIYRGGVRNPPKNDYGLLNEMGAAFAGQVSLEVLRNPTGNPDHGIEPVASLEAKRLAAADACEAYLQQVNPDYVEAQPDIRYYIWDKYIEQSDGTKTMQTPAEREHLYATKDQVESTKAWILENADQPWCAALMMITPHDPLHVPPAESYKINFADPANPTIQEMLIAMTESMDFYIGELLNDPELQEQLENTVIVFIGDNGTQGSVRDIGGGQVDNDVTDKNTYYIGAVHVPMIITDGGVYHDTTPCYLDIEGDGNQAGDTIADQVHLIDLYATTLDIAGASVPEGSDSISMNQHLTGLESQTRVYNFGQMYPGPYGDVGMVSDGRYKLAYSSTGTMNMSVAPGYLFSELVPHTEPNVIPGALKDQEIPLDDTLSTELRAKLDELYAELIKQRLNGEGDEFPPLPV